MYFISFLRKSANDMNTPRAMTSRSILANHSSIWLSQEESVGVKVQVNLRMSIHKVVNLSRLMGREIVSYHVDLFAARLVDNDVRQERDELRRGVSHGRLAEYLAGLSVERRVQGQRAVPEVLKAVPFGASR